VPEGVQTLAWRRSLLNACRDAAQALFGEKPLIDAVEYIALRFKEATGLRWMVIGLADLEQGTLEFPAGQVAALGLPAVWKMGETLSGQAILSNRPVIHFDAAQTVPAHPLMLTVQPASICVFPIRCAGECVGSLVIGSERTLTPEHAEDCEMLADFLSDCFDVLAEQRSRNRDLLRLTQQLQREAAERHELHRELQRVQEQERAHVARELHDELGQLLTAANVNLAVLKDHLGTDRFAQSRIEVLDEVMAATLDTVRSLARRLRPPLLDDMGLVPALQWYVEEYCQRAGLDCTVESTLTVCLQEQSALALFRMCQEALTNVVRHARAGKVRIALSQTDETVTLEVSDDGRGLAGARPGLGLAGIRERAAQLGGTLQLDSSEGGGVRLQVQAPLEPMRCRSCPSPDHCRYLP
jgi:signal transduction histidine kinase